MFAVKRQRIQISSFFPLILLVAVLIIFCFAVNSVASTNSKREQDILSHALDKSITQCYALEGFYPSSLSYLEDNYGLTYDKGRYFIDYQFIGSNLRPDTTIIERD